MGEDDGGLNREPNETAATESTIVSGAYTGWFLGALFLGAISITAGVLVPWAPLALVVAYGFRVLLDIRYRHAHLADFVLDSSYYLGFLFTLLALTITFANNLQGVAQPVDLGPLLRGIATAVYTTIAGLVFRYVLSASAARQDKSQERLLALEEDLRRSASAFVASQQSLVGILKDFSAEREELFERERKAWQDLTQQLESFAKSIDDSLTGFERALREKLESQSAEYSKAFKDAVRARKELAAELSSLKDTALSPLAVLATKLSELVSTMETLRSGLENAHVVEPLQAAGESSRRLDSSLGHLQQTLDSVSRDLCDGFAPTKGIHSDLKALDVLLDEFLALLRKKLEVY